MKKILLFCAVLCMGLAGCVSDASSTVSGSSTGVVEEASELSPVADTSAGQQDAAQTQLFAMDAYMELRAYGAGADSALLEISSMLTQLDRQLSVTDENSEVFAINHSDGQATVVSEQTYTLIRRTLELSETLGSALDVTIYPISRTWGFTTGDYQIPTQAQLQALLPRVDDTKLCLQESERSVQLPPGAELDLGAVAKGYAGDCAAQMLKERGIRSALLSLGSSTIRTVGLKPDGGKWRIAIRDPQDPDAFAGVVTMGEGAMDTSGGYERYFVGEDGETYWHILDPQSGRPAKSGLISATVLSETAFEGDGLSTALFVMGAEQTVRFWRETGGFEFILITEDGSILVSEGAAEIFSPLGAYETAELTVVTP